MACDHLYLASPDRINKLRAGKCSNLRTGAGGDAASLSASTGSLAINRGKIRVRLIFSMSEPKYNCHCVCRNTRQFPYFLVSVITMSLSRLRMKISGPKHVSVSVWELMPWPGRYSLIVSWLMGRMPSVVLLATAESVLALSTVLLVTVVNAG